MIRLHVVTEGKSEEVFANTVLAPYLSQFGVYADARSVCTSMSGFRKFSGGIASYGKVRNDIRLWTRQDRSSDCRFTCMFDFYALPSDFPGYSQAMQEQDPYARVRLLEDALAEDIGDWRFVPYIQLHEFEALLLCDLMLLGTLFVDERERLEQFAASIAGKEPELINGGRESAPSKRLLQAFPGYRKVFAIETLGQNMNLDTIMEKCPHFRAWLLHLQHLGVES